LRANPPASAAAALNINGSPVRALATPASRCRVLIVDDDALVLSWLSALVQAGGYETHTATSGSAALRILAATPCQIVLTDWHMPEMDGLALCCNLRSRVNDRYIYILLVSVRSARSDIVAGLAAGADDYVVKGGTREDLLARIGLGQCITQLERAMRISNRGIRRVSVTDPLTGARTRRFLMKYLPRELQRARLSSRSLAILSCDIDHFKQIQDNYGHDVGDAILQEFVRRAVSCIQPKTGWIARSGPEAFVLVLPEASQNEASYVAAKLRQTLAANAMCTRAGRLEITVSIGIAVLAADRALSATSGLDLLRAADRGLYMSKRLGRDRATALRRTTLGTQ
jgi:two-component system, cell cycle response regulator